jgi:general secretion pathway protein E
MQPIALKSNSKRLGVIRLAAKPIRIGRHPSNDVVLKDDLASRFHAVVEPDDHADRWIVRDLDSRNGIRVNNERVDCACLSTGDEVRIGQHVFTVAPVPATPDAAKGSGHDKQAWARELSALIKELPFPEDRADEWPVLIDAGGDRSKTLESKAVGPVATRLLLLASNRARATDLHVEPRPEHYIMRMRVDGQMVHIADMPSDVGRNVIQLVHTACRMPPEGRDAVLDGSFGLEVAGRRVDCRASLTPTVHGQKLVVRFLDGRTAPRSLSDLEMPAYMEQRVRKVCEKDTGLLLVCGPTGSGKTTTLYNGLREIDRQRRNVITIEDPIEHHLDDVTQIPVTKGHRFDQLLRSCLRQDPDVILVGEIRDAETARTAMQAAMTGHVVFTTVHAKDTIGAVFRLLDLGVENYLVANALDVIVAQRLIRLLCPACKRPVRVSPGQATRMGRFLGNKDRLSTATGCGRCLRTGYHGRRALFEMLDFNEELRDLVLSEPSIHAMRTVIEQGVFTTLQQAGWQLAAQQLTSLDEVDRVASHAGR